mgnify:FL=1|jgi:peptidyl-tRNA hydrolase, PTH2 family
MLWRRMRTFWWAPAAVRASASKVISSPNDCCKMVMVVRTDLKMGKGKIGAQCGHAVLGAYQIAEERFPQWVESWEESGVTKVALKCAGESELEQLYRGARAAKLPCYLVIDAGRTQIASGSKTVLAIGPAPESKVNAITGQLPLL